MTLLAVGALAWLAFALPFGVVLGRGMRTADRSHEAARMPTTVPDFIPDHIVASVVAQKNRRD